MSIKVGFIRIKDEHSPEGEYRPIYPITDREKMLPSKIVYLESPTKRYSYILIKEEDKP